MDAHVMDVVRACSRESDAESITFGAVVGRLVAAGVERYHADLVRSEKTYFMPDGGNLVTPCRPVETMPAPDFSASGVDAAVRAVQGGSIGYNEFCERIAAAGCVGYFVSLAGRRAIYYGRTAETHVETFPGSR